MTTIRILLATALTLAALGATAAPSLTHQPDADARAQEVVSSPGFLAAHPDLRFRLLGQQAQQRGRWEDARTFYRQAARYADKPSQAALAELTWDGHGEPADRALAYAWMDLAAQRGTVGLVMVRERYWSELDAGERAEAVRKGEAVYAEYGDSVAKPRQEREMRRVRMERTGSRVGGMGALDVCKGAARTNAPGGSCGAPFSQGEYYADRYWEPAAYWRWQGDLLAAPQRQAGTDAGPAEQLRD